MRHLPVQLQFDAHRYHSERALEPERLEGHCRLVEPADPLDRIGHCSNMLCAGVLQYPFLHGGRAQQFYLLQRLYVLGTVLRAVYAAHAVPYPVLLRELREPPALLALPDVANEPPGLRARRRADEISVYLKGVALGVAAAAHDAPLAVVDPLLGLCRNRVSDALLSRRQIGGNLINFAPEGLHVDHQVLYGPVISERLDRHLAHLFVLGQYLKAACKPGKAIDGHRAGTADGRAAGLPERERGVLFLLNLQERFEDGHALRYLDRICLIIGLRGLGVCRVITPYAEFYFHILILSFLRLVLRNLHILVSDLDLAFFLIDESML